MPVTAGSRLSGVRPRGGNRGLKPTRAGMPPSGPFANMSDSTSTAHLETIGAAIPLGRLCQDIEIGENPAE